MIPRHVQASLEGVSCTVDPKAELHSKALPSFALPCPAPALVTALPMTDHTFPFLKAISLCLVMDSHG